MKVKSHSSNKFYDVYVDDNGILKCSCPYNTFKRQKCKHMKEFKDNKKFIVKSFTHNNIYYTIQYDDNNKLYCSCPDHIYRKRQCKHIKSIL